MYYYWGLARGHLCHSIHMEVTDRTPLSVNSLLHCGALGIECKLSVLYRECFYLLSHLNSHHFSPLRFYYCGVYGKVDKYMDVSGQLQGIASSTLSRQGRVSLVLSAMLHIPG